MLMLRFRVVLLRLGRWKLFFTLGCRWRVPLTWVHNPSSVLLLYRDQLDAQTLDQVIIYVKVYGSIVLSFILT